LDLGTYCRAVRLRGTAMLRQISSLALIGLIRSSVNPNSLALRLEFGRCGANSNRSASELGLTEERINPMRARDEIWRSIAVHNYALIGLIRSSVNPNSLALRLEFGRCGVVLLNKPGAETIL
jgi:hypothetical protein